MIHKTKVRKGSAVECPVCGKAFPRGQLDLTRHMNAVTLQHIYSNKQNSIFTVGCATCGVYFRKQEHLDMHLTLTTHLRNTGDSALADDEANDETPLDQEFSGLDDEEREQVLENRDEVVIGNQIAATGSSSKAVVEVVAATVGAVPSTAKSDPTLDSTTVSAIVAAAMTGGAASSAAAAAAAMAEMELKTMECMICGKLFPRGPIDLQRHATGISLCTNHAFFSFMSFVSLI